MKTTNKIWALALAASMLSFSSCQEDAILSEVEIQDAENSSVYEFPSDNITQDLDDFAFILSSSIGDKEITKAIKEEALKMFDGDYDILYKDLRNKEVSKGNNFNQRMAVLSSNARMNNARSQGRSIKQVADSIAALYPNLQVSVPVNIENWDADKYPPLIAICPNILEKDMKMIKAYDQSGKVHWLDAKEEPTNPVIVVGLSERTDGKGNLLKSFEKEIAPTNGRVRTNGFAEKVFQAYCYNLNTYEGWVHGAPELRVVISTGKVASIVDQTFDVGSRSDIKDSWWTAPADLLFKWYREDYGDVAVYQWFEWDGNGDAVKLTGSVSYKDESSKLTFTTGYEITYKKGDFDLGKKVVNYKDNSGQEYSIGWIKWKGYN